MFSPVTKRKKEEARKQAEAEVVPSSSLVEIEVWAGVGVEVFLLFRVGGWSGVVGEVVDKAISAFN